MVFEMLRNYKKKETIMTKEITFAYTSYNLLPNKINSHTDIYIYMKVLKSFGKA